MESSTESRCCIYVRPEAGEHVFAWQLQSFEPVAKPAAKVEPAKPAVAAAKPAASGKLGATPAPKASAGGKGGQKWGRGW